MVRKLIESVQYRCLGTVSAADHGSDLDLQSSVNDSGERRMMRVAQSIASGGSSLGNCLSELLVNHFSNLQNTVVCTAHCYTYLLRESKQNREESRLRTRRLCRSASICGVVLRALEPFRIKLSGSEPVRPIPDWPGFLRSTSLALSAARLRRAILCRCRVHSMATTTFVMARFVSSAGIRVFYSEDSKKGHVVSARQLIFPPKTGSAHTSEPLNSSDSRSPAQPQNAISDSSMCGKRKLVGSDLKFQPPPKFSAASSNFDQDFHFILRNFLQSTKLTHMTFQRYMQTRTAEIAHLHNYCSSCPVGRLTRAKFAQNSLLKLLPPVERLRVCTYPAHANALDHRS